MKTLLAIVTALSAFAVQISYQNPTRDQTQNVRLEEGGKVNFFVLMVPESSLHALRVRFRQDEETAETVTQIGEYVSTILQGVLGANVSLIFGGGTDFIDNPDVQEGVSTILSNVAPTVSNIVKQWLGSATNALGITTTGRPGSAVPASNRTRPANINGTVLGEPITAAQAAKLTPQELIQLAQVQQQLQQLQAQHGILKPDAVLGTHVVSTTVKPLSPANTTPVDEDDDDSKRVN